MSLCVTDTRGSHSELTGEFAAIRNEMEAVASQLGGRVLGQVREADFWAALPRLRTACGDRAVLRAAHYFEENARALVQRDALPAGDFPVFLKAIAASGHASYTLCQNVYCSTDVRHQGLSVALALSQTLLEHSGGAWRMQGGGFAGTIQAFVPQRLVQTYHDAMEGVFGKGLLHPPPAGAGSSPRHLKCAKKESALLSRTAEHFAFWNRKRIRSARVN